MNYQFLVLVTIKNWLMMQRLLFLLLLIAMGCSSPNNENATVEEEVELSKAQKVVNAAIASAGADRYDRCDVSFLFRDIEYRGYRNDGQFKYERKFVEEEDSVHDIYSNDGFTRLINNQVVDLPDSMSAKYTNSVNSVLYFIFLPRPLNDEAVIKEYLGEAEIKGNAYHKIKVTFQQEGGGEDFTDQFVYWFEKDSYDMDYFAYLYFTDGGGIRFREAFNTSEVNGIKFLDYINYKFEDMEMPVEKLDSVYLAGGLEELSRIEQSDIQVTLLEE